MLLVELAKAVHRWRTWALALVLGAIPTLFVVALKLSPPEGADDGPPFSPRPSRTACSPRWWRWS
ncbi:MAG: hypothetical protein ACRDVL_00550 [Acidimicrobiia bacterium]